MRRSLILGCAVTMTLTLAACGSTAGTTPASETVAQASVTPAVSAAAPIGLVTITSADVPAPTPLVVTPPSTAPARIVSLATGVGETLAALGVADRVVGRDETSDVPQIHDAPIVTKAHATNAEKVLALDPDLVLVDEASGPPEAIDQIRAAGIAVVEIPEAFALAEIAPRTRAVAAAVGLTEADADKVIAAATSSEVVNAVATPPRVVFLYLRGTSAIYLVGGKGSGADALIDAAGGIDAGAAADFDPFVPLTAEAVATLDPDVLLVMTKGLESVGGLEGLVELPGVAETKAGQNGRVVAVDDTLLLSFGPRTGNLVDALSAAIGAK